MPPRPKTEMKPEELLRVHVEKTFKGLVPKPPSYVPQPWPPGLEKYRLLNDDQLDHAYLYLQQWVRNRADDVPARRAEILSLANAAIAAADKLDSGACRTAVKKIQEIVQIRWRQHYVPQFYLAQWITPGAKTLWEYKWDGAKVVQREARPESTAYVDHLATFVEWGDTRQKNPDQIETDDLGIIDGEGDAALKELLAKPLADVSVDARRQFARWVWSLLVRAPRVLASRDNHARAFWETASQDVRNHIPVETMVNPGRRTLREQLANEAPVQFLCSLTWVTLDAAALLTSDTPAIVNFGKDVGPDGAQFVQMALSPQKLLFMHRPNHPQAGDEALQLFKDAHPLMLLAGLPGIIYSQTELNVPQRSCVDTYLGRSGPNLDRM